MEKIIKSVGLHQLKEYEDILLCRLSISDAAQTTKTTNTKTVRTLYDLVNVLSRNSKLTVNEF